MTDVFEKNGQQKNQRGAIVIPAMLWFAGVPFFLVLLLWLFFFRG